MDKSTLIIISILVAAAIVGFLALRFDAFRNWLVYAVSESESVFGGGTGKLKACKALPTEQYLTIGYGHYGADVKAGQTITEAEAVKLLKSDLKTYVSAVNSALKVTVTQNQFDALVSLCYNIGTNGFKSSDMVTLLNQSKLMRAACEFVLWRKSGGNIIAGLQNRRTKELNTFLTGVSYTLNSVMNVRTGPGTSYSVKKTLAKGKSVKITEVRVNYSTTNIDIWVKTSHGWLCLKSGNEYYFK